MVSTSHKHGNIKSKCKGPPRGDFSFSCLHKAFYFCFVANPASPLLLRFLLIRSSPPTGGAYALQNSAGSLSWGAKPRQDFQFHHFFGHAQKVVGPVWGAVPKRAKYVQHRKICYAGCFQARLDVVGVYLVAHKVAKVLGTGKVWWGRYKEGGVPRVSKNNAMSTAVHVRPPSS